MARIAGYSTEFMVESMIDSENVAVLDCANYFCALRISVSNDGGWEPKRCNIELTAAEAIQLRDWLNARTFADPPQRVRKY